MKVERHVHICLLVLLTYFVSSAKGDTLRTVTLSGDTAPGTVAEFSFLSSPVLNDAGQAAFQGGLTGSGISSSNDRGIWSEGSGTLTLVARKGEGAVGTTSTFSNFGLVTKPIINDTGQTAFRGTLASAVTDIGIWSEGEGSLSLVARNGDIAPDTSVSLSSILVPSTPVLNDAGQTAFQGILTGPGVAPSNDRGIWSEGNGSLALIARAGDGAPGTTASYSHFGSIVLNDVGQAAFHGSLTPSTDGIWSEGGGSLNLVARNGDGAPGTSANFSFLSGPAINNAGQTAFQGLLKGTSGVTTSDNEGIWSEGSGSLSLVTRKGDGAPGTSVSFAGLGSPVINRVGQTAFQASLTGPGVNINNSEGIWFEDGGSLSLVAREGDGAPGTSASFRSISDPILNGAGQVAFSSFLTGSGVSSNNDRGIWAQDLSGMLTLIAREGDLLDVDGGPGTDFRAIIHLSFVTGSGNEDGRASGFNELGQVAFLAIFADNSRGIFVSNLVAVPEPTSAVFFGCISIKILALRLKGNRQFGR